MILHTSTTGGSRKKPRAGKHVQERSICTEMGVGIYNHEGELARDSGRAPRLPTHQPAFQPDTPAVPRTGTTVYQQCPTTTAQLLQYHLSKRQLEGHFWLGPATGVEWAGPGTRALQHVEMSLTRNFPKLHSCILLDKTVYNDLSLNSTLF